MSDTPKPALVVRSRIHVKPERRSEVVEAALRMSKVCRQVEGCLEYTVTEDLEDSGGILVFEVWSDPAALTLSFQFPEVCELKELLRRIHAREPETHRFRLAA